MNRLAYEANYRDDLEQTDTGRIALMHEEKLVDVYDDPNIACEDGVERYGSGNYSIVWIGAKPLSLGIFTFALPAARIPSPLEGCDVLLGMDLISQWHVTLHDGRCIIRL